jgi:hypothetical protein
MMLPFCRICGEHMMYGANCSTCGHQLKIPKGNLNINYPQHKSRKKLIIGIIVLSFVIWISIPGVMTILGIDLTSPEQKLQQKRDAYYQRMQDAQDEYELNPPSYVPLDQSCYDGKINC